MRNDLERLTGLSLPRWQHRAEGLGGAGRQPLVAPAAALVRMKPELVGHLPQGLAALPEPLDRLGLVLGGEPAPLPLLHRPFPVLVGPPYGGVHPAGEGSTTSAPARAHRS